MKEDPDFFFFFFCFLHIPFLWKHYGKQRRRLLSGGAAWCVPISADTQKKKRYDSPTSNFSHWTTTSKTSSTGSNDITTGNTRCYSFFFFPQIHLLFWTCFTKGGGGRGEKKTIFRLDLKLLRFAAYLTVHWASSWWAVYLSSFG